MSTTEGRRGLFLTFEGMDGCGKTTQMKRLAERLRGAGYEVVETVEPGGTAVGCAIRRIVLDASHRELSPTAELLLYFASRAQNVEQVILPALRRGQIVLSDRFTDSTLAYQGAGRGLGEEVVRQLDRIATGGLKPDLTVLLDIDLETSLARARARNLAEPGAGTRMDEQAVEFYRRVRDAYERLAAQEPARFVIVDGRGEPEAVAEAVWKAVTARLPGLHV
ncbi:MAG TPA: dTMP kinase [Bryobacteraceae bacterium]|nr:dTMP kinase [Bryobacteraceae bacterium]